MRDTSTAWSMPPVRCASRLPLDRLHDDWRDAHKAATTLLARAHQVQAPRSKGLSIPVDPTRSPRNGGQQLGHEQRALVVRWRH